MPYCLRTQLSPLVRLVPERHKIVPYEQFELFACSEVARAMAFLGRMRSHFARRELCPAGGIVRSAQGETSPLSSTHLECPRGESHGYPRSNEGLHLRPLIAVRTTS